MKVHYKQFIFAREYRGYTQTELSSKIKGLSQSNLSKFEKGLGLLSDEVLQRIIQFLDFPESFFTTKISNTIENAHYRKKAAITKAEKAKLEYSNKLIGYIIDQMAEAVEYPQFKFKEVNVEDGYSPSTIAQFVRKQFGLKDEPIADIFSFLERNGIIVIELDSDNESFDGVSFITDNGFHVIVINKNFTNDRKRFTLAHELGHILMHLSSDFIIADYRDVEQEANNFASEFLMPESAIKNSLYGLKLSALVPLKEYWLTSMASIIRRARDLKCIDGNKYQYFNIELSRKGYKKEEPINVDIDYPTIFNKAYKLHKTDLNYTDQELANAFSLPIDIIDKFCSNKTDIVRLRPKKMVI